ncbi:hypothetical protein BU17DRAFT_87065 [Hysterangium stoloniferum]|nr:hypothetical protein BU17DRAFT_87065 [Hysterangium stoloniferum]
MPPSRRSKSKPSSSLKPLSRRGQHPSRPPPTSPIPLPVLAAAAPGPTTASPAPAAPSISPPPILLPPRSSMLTPLPSLPTPSSPPLLPRVTPASYPARSCICGCKTHPEHYSRMSPSTSGDQNCALSGPTCTPCDTPGCPASAASSLTLTSTPAGTVQPTVPQHKLSTS